TRPAPRRPPCRWLRPGDRHRGAGRVFRLRPAGIRAVVRPCPWQGEGYRERAAAAAPAVLRRPPREPASAPATAGFLPGGDDADLDPAIRCQALDQRVARHVLALDHRFDAAAADRADPPGRHALLHEIVADAARTAGRSEERRVGKECRGRWATWESRKQTHVG